jgi:hypothetical protein
LVISLRFQPQASLKQVDRLESVGFRFTHPRPTWLFEEQQIAEILDLANQLAA